MADETYPEDLMYHQEHDWVRIDGDEATFGITWYAQDALGEVVFFDPPEVGSVVVKDESYGELESVKAVSDIFWPAGGEVLRIHPDDSFDLVMGTPRLTPVGLKTPVRLGDPAELDALMDEPAYRAYLAGL